MECAICLTSLLNPYTLPCNHSFHEDCIERVHNELCPLCRTPYKLSVDIYVMSLAFVIDKPYTSIYQILLQNYPELFKDAVKVFCLNKNIRQPSTQPKIIIFYFREKQLRDLWWSRLVLQNEFGSALDTSFSDTDQILVHISHL